MLVIHGTDDEVIDISHGVAIYERCPRPVEPLFIEVIHRYVYFFKLNVNISSMFTRQSFISKFVELQSMGERRMN